MLGGNSSVVNVLMVGQIYLRLHKEVRSRSVLCSRFYSNCVRARGRGLCSGSADAEDCVRARGGGRDEFDELVFSVQHARICKHLCLGEERGGGNELIMFMVRRVPPTLGLVETQ